MARLFSSCIDLTVISMFISLFARFVSKHIFLYFFGDFIGKYNIDLSDQNIFYKIAQMPEFRAYEGIGLFPYLLLVTGINIAIMALYFIYSWSHYGTTLGKLFMNMRVVDSNGCRPSTYICIKRFIGYFLFPIGIWFILGTRYKQGLHDKIAGTFVVKK